MEFPFELAIPIEFLQRRGQAEVDAAPNNYSNNSLCQHSQLGYRFNPPDGD